MNEISVTGKAVVVFTERKSVYMGESGYSAAFQEVSRADINTDTAPTAIAWAKTFRKPWQGFVVILCDKIVAMEQPQQ